MEARSKFQVKKNYSSREPHRVLSVINLTATDFIQTSPLPKDKFSKFPTLKPKISRRKSEIIRRPHEHQPAWIAHYRENITRQLNLSNRHDISNDFRVKKVTLSFCEFLKKKEAELKKLQCNEWTRSYLLNTTTETYKAPHFHNNCWCIKYSSTTITGIALVRVKFSHSIVGHRQFLWTTMSISQSSLNMLVSIY